MNRKRKSILLAMAAISAAAIIALLYHFNYLPHPRYSGQAFGIDTYVSTVDMDGDGIDDQSDILLSAREYVSQRPRYKSVYYGSGYPDDQYGVCTDVVAFGALGAVLAYFFRRDTFAQSMYNFFFFPTDVPMPVIGAIWFLMSLFLSESIYYLFFTFFKNTFSCDSSFLNFSRNSRRFTH